MKGIDQAQLQMQLAASSQAARIESLVMAHEALKELREIFLLRNKLLDDEHTWACLMIETICRVESIEEGRGAFYRLRRRLALSHQYFKP